MAIATMDDMIAAMGRVVGNTPQAVRFFRRFTPSNGSARAWSLWTQPGAPGPAAAYFTTAAVPTAATIGALPLVDPSGGASAYLSRFTGLVEQAGAIVLFDLLSAQGGISATAAGAQTSNLPTAALTRGDTTGAGVEGWLVISTTFTAGARTITVSYTNQAGTSGRSGTVDIPATGADAHCMFPVGLQSGDTGIRSIQSATISSTLAAGVYGFHLLRRLATSLSPAGWDGDQQDVWQLGLTPIEAGTCFFPVALLASTSACLVEGEMQILRG